jgi:hypothetical protein
VRFVSIRLYLARAVQLGFTEVPVTNPNAPVVCRQGTRTYVWIMLDRAGALLPSDDVLRITSGDEAAAPKPPKERRRVLMPRPLPNGHAATPRNGAEAGLAPTNGATLGSLLAEAQALRDTLHDACGRSARLVAALKRQKKQSKLVASTLASLRQLQQIEG